METIKCVSCPNTIQLSYIPPLAYICPKCADKCIMEIYLKYKRKEEKKDEKKNP